MAFYDDVSLEIVTGSNAVKVTRTQAWPSSMATNVGPRLVVDITVRSYSAREDAAPFVFRLEREQAQEMAQAILYAVAGAYP